MTAVVEANKLGWGCRPLTVLWKRRAPWAYAYVARDDADDRDVQCCRAAALFAREHGLSLRALVVDEQAALYGRLLTALAARLKLRGRQVVLAGSAQQLGAERAAELGMYADVYALVPGEWLCGGADPDSAVPAFARTVRTREATVRRELEREAQLIRQAVVRVMTEAGAVDSDPSTERQAG